jgi:hypothetical protein
MQIFNAKQLVVFTLLLLSQAFSCDTNRKDACEWYLIPNSDQVNLADGEYIPVCARNFVSNKEDCRLKAKLDFAKSIYNKKFRFGDMTLSGKEFPRTVESIKTCE